MLAHDDHVVVARQLRIVAHIVHRDVVEGDAVLVQPEPQPALVLRVGPGVHDRDAWNPGLVGRDIELRARAVGGEAVLGARHIEDRAEIDLRVVLLPDHEGPGVEGTVVVGEVGLGRVDHEVVVREAEGGQGVVGVVVDEVGAAAASFGPARDRHGLDERHLGVEDGGVFNPHRLRVEERADRPPDVVVGTRVVRVVVLLVEEHVGPA